MKIDAIEVFRVEMPLVYPFRTAFGNDDRIESVLVKLKSGALHGWGEATPWQTPGYSPESASTAFLVIRDYLAPAILGKSPVTGADLQETWAHIKGNPFAKAAVDLAWWDLRTKNEGLPLYQAIGGNRDTVEVGADFGIMESIDLLLDTIATAVDEGFKRVKLKYRPGWDLPMIEAVRDKFPNLVVHVDCNSAYTLRDIAMLRELDNFNLAMIEQPLMSDDLIDHATLQAELKTPICLDESITSVDRARKAIQIKACGWINIKPGRVGGLTHALAIHDICEEMGVPCWVGGMLESAVGAHHCLALATLDNFRYPADIFPSSRFYKDDLSRPQLQLSAPSTISLPNSPGCGAAPDPNNLNTQTLESFSANS